MPRAKRVTSTRDVVQPDAYRERVSSFSSDVSDELEAIDREIEAEAAAAANERTKQKLSPPTLKAPVPLHPPLCRLHQRAVRRLHQRTLRRFRLRRITMCSVPRRHPLVSLITPAFPYPPPFNCHCLYNTCCTWKPFMIKNCV